MRALDCTRGGDGVWRWGIDPGVTCFVGTHTMMALAAVVVLPLFLLATFRAAGTLGVLPDTWEQHNTPYIYVPTWHRATGLRWASDQQTPKASFMSARRQLGAAFGRALFVIKVVLAATSTWLTAYQTAVLALQVVLWLLVLWLTRAFTPHRRVRVSQFRIALSGGIVWVHVLALVVSVLDDAGSVEIATWLLLGGFIPVSAVVLLLATKFVSFAPEPRQQKRRKPLTGHPSGVRCVSVVPEFTAADGLTRVPPRIISGGEDGTHRPVTRFWWASGRPQGRGEVCCRGAWLHGSRRGDTCAAAHHQWR